jgi:hypothetical protein
MTITALVGLSFSIISIRLMMIIESRQSFMNISESYNMPVDLVLGETRGAHKLTLMKLMARVLSKVSTVIFCLQGLYPEIRSPLTTCYSTIK